ncbi:SDR family oxidoreductase [Xanthomonas campestris]|uniref:SDR family oxidoreductase n=1 Tax=Xanthomonas campestris TaxID=339 RepID=UPI003CF6612B
MNLTSNTILITGGATGIGFALARALVVQGNTVIICGRSAAALRQAKDTLPALITQVCDITDTASRRALVDWLRVDHPHCNVLINNAGVQQHRDFTGTDAVANLDQEIAINLAAPIHLSAELLPLLQQQQHAAIINITSGLAFSPMADVPVYCATKAALHSFTLSLRHQLKGSAVRVIEIAPPIVDTGLGGGTRSAGTATRNMMSAEQFAAEAMTQLEDDKDEVLIGISADTRRLGEALFARMNHR